MKHSTGYRWTLRAIAFVSMALLTGTSTLATTHIVKFGGSAGFKYVPAAFTAAVGDTVAWEGDFAVHPLSSTTTPAGSTAWHVATGTRFTYVVTGQGAFNYKCDLHSGMTGSFQAGITGIDNAMQRRGEVTETMRLTPVLSASGRSSIQFTAPDAGVIAMRIIDLSGREIATATQQVSRQGVRTLPLAEMKSHGIYCVKTIFNGKETSQIFTNMH